MPLLEADLHNWVFMISFCNDNYLTDLNSGWWIRTEIGRRIHHLEPPLRKRQRPRHMLWHSKGGGVHPMYTPRDEP